MSVGRTVSDLLSPVCSRDHVIASHFVNLQSFCLTGKLQYRTILSMSKFDPKSVPAPPPQPSPDARAPVDDLDRLPQAIARAERQLRTLEVIGEIGMRLMRKLADPPAANAPPADPAGDFAKLSRAVRLSIALERHVEEDLFAALTNRMTVRTAQRKAVERVTGEADEASSQDAKDRVAGQIGAAIVREVEGEAERGERYAAMIERLDYDEAYDDVRDRPLRDAVEQLCGDLGLAPDWSDWTDAGWPETAAARVGPGARPLFSPFSRPSPAPIIDRLARSANPYVLADP
jgi:hypothetical protein